MTGDVTGFGERSRLICGVNRRPQVPSMDGMLGDGSDRIGWAGRLLVGVSQRGGRVEQRAA
jgi:hypothetical protein